MSQTETENMRGNNNKNRTAKWYCRLCEATTAQWAFILFISALIILPPTYERNVRCHVDAGNSNRCDTGIRTPSKHHPVLPGAPKRLSNRTGLVEQRFDSLIHKVANRYEVDPALVKAIIKAESGYNPKAISKRGAKGLMQLMPGTAKALGVEDCFDPEHNINGGVKYFKELLERFNGNVKLSLAAYNAGARKVRRYGGVPPFKATRYYIDKVFEYYSLYKQTMNIKVGSV